MSDSDVFIVSAVRTAIGSGKETGALHPLHPVELTALVMQEAVRRAGVESRPARRCHLGRGHPARRSGRQPGAARRAQGGLPHPRAGASASTACAAPASRPSTLRRSPSWRATTDLVLAGGTEMMSHQPLGADYPTRMARRRSSAHPSGTERRTHGRKNGT